MRELSQPGDNTTLSRLGHNTSPPHRKQSRPTSQTSLSRSGDNVSLHWSRLSIGSLPDGREFFCTYVMISLILVTFPHTQFSSHLVSRKVPNIALSTNVWKRLFRTPVIFAPKVVSLVHADWNCEVKAMFSPVRERLARERGFLDVSRAGEVSGTGEVFWGPTSVLGRPSRSHKSSVPTPQPPTNWNISTQ